MVHPGIYKPAASLCLTTYKQDTKHPIYLKIKCIWFGWNGRPTWLNDDLALKLKRITNANDLSHTEPGPRAPVVCLSWCMQQHRRGTFLSGTLAQVPLNHSTAATCGHWPASVWVMVTSLSANCLKFGYILIMRSKPLASSQTLFEIDLKGRFKWAEIWMSEFPHK